MFFDRGRWVGGLVALQGGVQVASQGFELAYVGEDGREHRAPLTVIAGTAFELVPQVRSFPSFRGQRNNTGLWWSAATDDHVGYESWLERDHLTLLDFDPAVVAMASQPFWSPPRTPPSNSASRQLTTDNRALDERLKAARSTLRFRTAASPTSKPRSPTPLR